MTVIRVVLALLGVVLAGYGAVLLTDNPPVVISRILIWAVVAVVVHDLVFAPLCAAAGWAGARVLGVSWRSPVAVAALCSVVLLLLAVPVLGRPGLRPDNPSVLDRDYPLGLAIALAVVWLSVPVYHLLRRLPVRQDQMVDGQRADDVERQPPAV
ncbi:hypothetical protein [Mycolicibacterium bacteremicum]|uniref:hypothetical protein n=1 Tax=Mycolicibacterium bacteremicum TaxID=564198 RepID=UPI0026EE456F|nr:hypothetical protein [Mycolicibacterium bacteremicum]